jgi:hypothetical protein
MIDTQVFAFQKNLRKEDGTMELSINWDDDEMALEFTLNQKAEDDTILFPVGGAIVKTADLDRLCVAAVCSGLFGYERDPIEGAYENKYHGNLLLRGDLPKQRVGRIAASLANDARYNPAD